MKLLFKLALLVAVLCHPIRYAHSQIRGVTVSPEFLDRYLIELIALSLSGTSSYDPLPKGVASALSTGIANALPVHSASAFPEGISVYDSPLGFRLNFSAGSLISSGAFNAQVIANIYKAIDLDFELPESVAENNVSIPLVMPYVAANLKFNSNFNRFKLIPTDISFKYGTTQILESTIVSVFTTPVFSINRYNSSFFGLNANYTLMKYKFHAMRLSLGYNYLFGGVLINADTGENSLNIIIGRYRNTAGEIISLRLTQTEINFGTEFAVGSLNANLIYHSQFSIFSTYMGLGGIVTAQNSTLTLANFKIFISDNSINTAQYEVNYNDFKEISVPSFSPQLLIGFRIFYADIGFYITPSAFAFKFGVSMTI